jgi:hypothetical protein
MYLQAGLISKISDQMIQNRVLYAFLTVSLENNPPKGISMINSASKAGFEIPHIENETLILAGLRNAREYKEGALNDINKMSNAQQRQQMMCGYLQQRALISPRDTALSVLSDNHPMANMDLKVEQLSHVMKSYIYQDVEESVKFLDSAPLQGEQKTKLFRNAFNDLAATSPDVAFEFFQKQENDMKSALTDNYLDVMTDYDPNYAYETINNIEDPDTKYSKLKEYGQKISDQDPLKIIELINTSEDTDVRDALLSGIVNSYTDVNANQAVDFALQITDAQSKNIALHNLHAYYKYRDPQIAQSIENLVIK